MKANKIYGLIGMLAMIAVCASAFAQDGPPPPDGQNVPPPQLGPRMRRTGPPMEPLFMRPEVQKELKLTDDQIQKLKALLPPPPPGAGEGPDMAPGGAQGAQRGGPPGDRRGMRGQPGGEQGMQPRMGMGPDQMDQKLRGILSDSQMKRLKELRLQRDGAMALSRKDIADQVGLSDDERLKIRGMIDEARDSMRPDQGGQPGQPPSRQEMEEMHKKLNDQILSTLSSKERSKWEELCGKPFKFDETWHPQGMRRGGDGPPPPQTTAVSSSDFLAC